MIGYINGEKLHDRLLDGMPLQYRYRMILGGRILRFFRSLFFFETDGKEDFDYDYGKNGHTYCSSR